MYTHLNICLFRLGTLRESCDGTREGTRCCNEGGVSGCSGDFDVGGANDGADDDLLRSRGCSDPDGGNAITMGDSGFGTGCDAAGDVTTGMGGCGKYHWGNRTAGLGGGYMGGPAAGVLPTAKAATAARLAAIEDATDSRVVIPGGGTMADGGAAAGDADSPLQPLLTLAHSDGGRCKHNRNNMLKYVLTVTT